MPKVFGFTTRHGYRCVDVLLHDMCTTEDIFWSERKNSYVLAEVGDPPPGRVDRPDNRLTLPDGTPVRLLSINGIGEVRWEAMNYQLSSIHESPPSPNSDGFEVWRAAQHFKLSYEGKRL